MFLARDEPELHNLDADLNRPEGLGVLGSGSLAQPRDEGEQLQGLDVGQVLLGLPQTPPEEMRSAQISVVLGRPCCFWGWFYFQALFNLLCLMLFFITLVWVFCSFMTKYLVILLVITCWGYQVSCAEPQGFPAPQSSPVPSS